jgi:hypothetical protein
MRYSLQDLLEDLDTAGGAHPPQNKREARLLQLISGACDLPGKGKAKPPCGKCLPCRVRASLEDIHREVVVDLQKSDYQG